MSTLKIETRRMLKRLSELLAIGFNDRDIAETLNKEFGTKLHSGMVNRMIQKQAILKKQIVKADKDYREIYKSLLFSLKDKIEKNIDILEKSREVLLNRFEELKKDIPESKLMNYQREINNTARSINDSIRTASEILKRMETETHELKLSHVQNIQETISLLKTLEAMGYVKVSPEFETSSIYKELKGDNGDEKNGET